MAGTHYDVCLDTGPLSLLDINHKNKTYAWNCPRCVKMEKECGLGCDAGLIS